MLRTSIFEGDTVIPEGLPSWLVVTLSIAMLALVITALVFAIGSKNWSVGQSLLWVLAILLVPVVGSIVFLAVDGTLDRRRRTVRS